MNWATSTWAGTITTDQKIPTPAPPPGAETETNAWESAVVTAGGSVSGGRKTAVDTLIKALKSAGVWTKLDRLWLHAAENTQSGEIDIKGLVRLTFGGAPTFTANLGYTCTGAGAYLNYGFISSTDGVNYTLNAAHIGDWNLEDGQSTSAAPAAPNYTFMYLRYTDNNAYLRVNNNAGGGFANTDARGWIVANRSDASTVQGYKNGVSMGADSATGALALDTGVVTSLFRQHAALSLGGHLTAANQLALYNALRTYMNGTLVP